MGFLAVFRKTKMNGFAFWKAWASESTLKDEKAFMKIAGNTMSFELLNLWIISAWSHVTYTSPEVSGLWCHLLVMNCMQSTPSPSSNITIPKQLARYRLGFWWISCYGEEDTVSCNNNNCSWIFKKVSYTFCELYGVRDPNDLDNGVTKLASLSVSVVLAKMYFPLFDFVDEISDIINWDICFHKNPTSSF